MNEQPPTQRATQWILRGTFWATISLSALLISYDIIVHSTWTGQHIWALLIAGLYLLLAELLYRSKHYVTVNWLLVLFYEALAFSTLVAWGLNAPIGILTICFAVMLPSILMKPRSAFIVMVLSAILLFAVQLAHAAHIVTPNLSTLSQPSSLWDVTAYVTVLSIFTLSSWLSGSAREKTLARALEAEKKLQAQRDNLQSELEKESAALRQTQLKQIRELYKFALLGQSTAATLHELSSHLSVLSLDIDDLTQQHAHSRAIANSKDSINHINKMVRQAKQQLNTYGRRKVFNPCIILNRSIKDMQEKFARQNVKLIINAPVKGPLNLEGSPIAFMQIITILLNNALDACCSVDEPRVIVSLTEAGKQLVVSIIDNGPGVDPTVQPTLFKPVTSAKPTGMGIGLYVARHLTENHFKGTLELKPQSHGAHFAISVPLGQV